MSIQAIFIEAGHGKGLTGLTDPGACKWHGAQLYKERDYAVRLANRVISILQSKALDELKGVTIQGVGVETEANIRKKMQFVNTVIRENKLSPNKCLGIAIHMNSSISSQPSGHEVWHQKNGFMKGTINLAESLIRSWQSYNIIPLRPRAINDSKNSRFGRLYIDDALCPYNVVETGFISNFGDASTIQANIDRAAEAIAHGIMEYVRSLA